MSSTPSALDKSSILRSRPSAGPVQASSPHTPLSRSVSGLYGSPGSSFRIEDEHLLIFEFGTRHLRAGFAGEYAPRCNITYTPELWRRVGDYRQWGPDHELDRRNFGTKWAEQYELWDHDLRSLDLGLIEDRIEKLIREAESKYLLLDNRTKKVALVTSSSLPRPLLNLVVRRVFEGLQASSITVLPHAIMTAVSAGVRSAMIVDIGWFETTVTAVYEYREAMSKRSVRAGKMFSQEVANMLHEEATMTNWSLPGAMDFEEIEEVMCRVAWCKDMQSSSDASSGQDSPMITIPLPKSSGGRQAGLRISFDKLADPAEYVLLGKNNKSGSNDDDELPIPDLLYKTLLYLPADVRSLCLSNIIFTGGVSDIPGLKQRILQELDALIQGRKWHHIHKYSANPSFESAASVRSPLTVTTGNTTPSSTPPRKTMASSRSTSSSTEPEMPVTPAHMRAHDVNTIDAKLSALALKDAVSPPPRGELRAVETLGPWAGASLMTNLRIRGIVEIERERFMSHGLVGGALPGNGKASASVAQEAYPRTRQSLGANTKLAGEKSTGWSLGVWG